MTLTFAQAVILSIITATVFIEAIHSLFAKEVPPTTTVALTFMGLLIGGFVTISVI